MRGRFCGLDAVAVMVELLPDMTLAGSAEQLMVGGSKGLTVKSDWHAAVSPGFVPSLPFLPSFTSALTV